MSIGYILLSDRARWWEKLLNIILTTKLEENYIYELSNTSKNCIKRLKFCAKYAVNMGTREN